MILTINTFTSQSVCKNEVILGAILGVLGFVFFIGLAVLAVYLCRKWRNKDKVEVEQSSEPRGDYLRSSSIQDPYTDNYYDSIK